MRYTAVFVGFAAILLPMIASAAPSCDENFEGTLRLGHVYRFSDTYFNESSSRQRITNLTPTFTEQYDYDGAPSILHFGWTPWIVAKKGIVDPGEHGEFVETDSDYPIRYSPPIRSPKNLVVTYLVEYSTETNGVFGNPKTYLACKSYAVTWCGDGIVDSGDGEQCDAGTKNGQPGSGCSATCTVMTTNPVACARGNVKLPLATLINSGTAGLCPSGQAVNAFASTITGTITDFTWACDNSATGSANGGNCEAPYDSTQGHALGR